jgi:uncharacterized membrane protein
VQVCAPLGFVLAFFAGLLVIELAKQLRRAARPRHADDFGRPRGALLAVALVLAVAACAAALWAALFDMGLVNELAQYRVASLFVASMVAGLLAAAIAVQKLAVPRVARTEYDYLVLVSAGLFAFAVAGCYGLLAFNG